MAHSIESPPRAIAGWGLSRDGRAREQVGADAAESADVTTSTRASDVDPSEDPEKIDLVPALKRTLTEFLQDKGTDLAAALTYYAVLSLFPAILALTSLDFLGLGVPASVPSLGQLLQQGKANLDAWWIIVPTFVLLTVTMLLLTFIGDALRDAFDTRKS